MRSLVGITLTVLPDSQQAAVQVIERLATIMTGLAFDGIDSDLKVTPYESEDVNDA